MAKSWIKRLLSKDGRGVDRNNEPPLVAYFWDGGVPVAHIVQDISPAGFYLATKERWMLGTMIMMTLQRTRLDSDLPLCFVIALSKVIRHGDDGVGFRFIPVEASGGSNPAPGANAADRKVLDKFLQLLARD